MAAIFSVKSSNSLASRQLSVYICASPSKTYSSLTVSQLASKAFVELSKENS
jgi:hypothetical protein